MGLSGSRFRPNRENQKTGRAKWLHRLGSTARAHQRGARQAPEVSAGAEARGELLRPGAVVHEGRIRQRGHVVHEGLLVHYPTLSEL